MEQGNKRLRGRSSKTFERPAEVRIDRQFFSVRSRWHQMKAREPFSGSCLSKKSRPTRRPGLNRAALSAHQLSQMLGVGTLPDLERPVGRGEQSVLSTRRETE